MSTTIRWLDSARTAVLVQHIGDYTVEDILARMEDLNAMLDTADHEVAVVQDHRKVGKLRGNMLGHLGDLARTRHPLIMQSVIVAPSAVSRLIGAIYSRLFYPILFFDTFEEALAYLQIDTNLDDLVA
ncbi:MAG: hypothetical protein GYB68_01925 [Chloroflexi bacterium]|nr:hypothetical protein [Chloroflexota bacterium]